LVGHRLYRALEPIDPTTSVPHVRCPIPYGLLLHWTIQPRTDGLSPTRRGIMADAFDASLLEFYGISGLNEVVAEFCPASASELC